MTSTTSQKTIDELRKLFAAYGLPEQVVSDNGPQFVSDEFTTFLKSNGVKHIRCSPYHPSSNGAAERFVQTFKQVMKTGSESTPSLTQRLSNFLLTYRSTPHATTNAPPCELFLGRRVRTRFDLLRPDRDSYVSDKQAAQKASHDAHARAREFQVNQPVMARNWRPGPKWVPGVIVERLGPLSYRIRTASGVLWRRHVDHMRIISQPTTISDTVTTTDQPEEDFPPSTTRVTVEQGGKTPTTLKLPQEEPTRPPSPPTQSHATTEDTGRYPSRDRKAPVRYK